VTTLHPAATRDIACRAVGDPRGERRARNETAFRTVNEAIAAGRGLTDAGRLLPFVCECGRIGCTVILELTAGRYEAVRDDPRRFVIAPGHDSPDIERVVEEGAGWAVVEKFGEAGEIAEEDA
jgi:hypothetical protein